jgi:hypothetical protein
VVGGEKVKMKKIRFLLTVFAAWLIFLMVDFLAHATVLKPFWDKGYSSLKSLEQLFVLIPFGYLSFLFLTLLIGWVYVRIYGVSGNSKKGIQFGILFGGLFALSTFLAWYAALDLPAEFVFFVSLVYFVEILGVSWIFGFLYHPQSIKKRFWLVMLIVFLGFVISVALQNLLQQL